MIEVAIAVVGVLLGGGGLTAFLLWRPQQESLSVQTLERAINIVQKERDHVHQVLSTYEGKFQVCYQQKRNLERLCLDAGVPRDKIYEALNP